MVARTGWQVHRTRAEFTAPSPLPATLAGLPGDWQTWLTGAGIPAGTPFLISPAFEYDVTLNEFFCSVEMIASAENTQVGYARDVAAFLTFLWACRGGQSWRDATEADHKAYLIWRQLDPAGPRVSGATWDREVAAVHRFYQWQVKAGNICLNPIPLRERRWYPAGAGLAAFTGSGQSPATYSHGGRRERVRWLPPVSYRLWRDVGMRGYTAEGIADPRFHGRWAGRNATFCDLMVRTGLRLSEQAALTVLEMPLDRGCNGYQRFWLPPELAKGGSARWVYVPASIIADLAAYTQIDRADVIAAARARGRYQRIRRPLVIEDPLRPVAARAGTGSHHVRVSHLSAAERQRLLIDGPDGLEPASFWLSEEGLPLSVSAWKHLFAQANARCRRGGADVHAHPHMLRHTFAVVTLEQLQRGHIAALAELTAEQRGQYTRVFGDPLDWVRRRLGHRSVTTTQIYLHTLAELEMETRMALVPDGWEDPRDTPLTRLAGSGPTAPAQA